MEEHPMLQVVFPEDPQSYTGAGDHAGARGEPGRLAPWLNDDAVAVEDGQAPAAGVSPDTDGATGHLHVDRVNADSDIAFAADEDVITDGQVTGALPDQCTVGQPAKDIDAC